MSASHSTVDLLEDQAYLAHHFNCLTCCAAGRMIGDQTRCDAGLALWDAYIQADRARELQSRLAAAARIKPLRGPNK